MVVPMKCLIRYYVNYVFPVPLFRRTTEEHLANKIIYPDDRRYMVRVLGTMILSHVSKASTIHCERVGNALVQKFPFFKGICKRIKVTYVSITIPFAHLNNVAYKQISQEMDMICCTEGTASLFDDNWRKYSYMILAYSKSIPSQTKELKEILKSIDQNSSDNGKLMVSFMYPQCALLLMPHPSVISIESPI